MKVWIWVLVGFVLKFISRQVEPMGDAQPSMASDAASGRLGYHALAMLLLIASIACFIGALVSFFHNRTA